MSDPEISHRCAACGASVRHRAAFCPQCGNPMKENSAPGKGGNEIQAEREQSQTASARGLETDSMTKPPHMGKRSTTEKPSGRGRDTSRLADRPPISLEENAAGAVRRLRKASSAVIDQAAYDPSLRFLLVAGVLFLLFLLLVILSKVIR